jgi:PAS domain S-box-containing protein
MKPFLKQRVGELERRHPGAMVVALNATGEYLFANDACRTLLGYEPQEVIGHPATAFAAAEDIPHVQVTLQDAMLNNESVTVNIRVRTKAGKLKPVQGAAARVVDPETEEVYLVGWVLPSTPHPKG